MRFIPLGPWLLRWSVQMICVSLDQLCNKMWVRLFRPGIRKEPLQDSLETPGIQLYNSECLKARMPIHFSWLKNTWLWEVKGGSYGGQQRASVCLFWLLEKAYLMSQEENPYLSYSSLLWFMKSPEMSIEIYRIFFFFNLPSQCVWSMMPWGGGRKWDVWIHHLIGCGLLWSAEKRESAK